MLYKFAIDKEKNHLGTYQDNEDGGVPRGFTNVPTWTVPKGIVLIFDGSKWIETKDNRGLVLYSKKNSSLSIEWGLIREPNDKELEELTKRKPTAKNPIWDIKLNNWREKTEEEVKISILRDKGTKTVSFLKTEWAYDVNTQWLVQLSENQAIHWKRKVLVHDAYGELHRITRVNSNLLQQLMFNTYMKDKGITK